RLARRAVEQGLPLPAFLRHERAPGGTQFAAQGLAKAFGGIHAVEEASVAVADRTLHALIGPNGAGKTTLFNLMSGLYPPDRGRVLLDGREITAEPPHRIVAAGLARSFQITNLFPALSVGENLRLAVQAGDASHFDGWRRAASIAAVTSKRAGVIKFLGLHGVRGARGGGVSYGGQRLLDMGL